MHTSENQFLPHLPIPALLIDSKGVIRKLNRAYEKVFPDKANNSSWVSLNEDLSLLDWRKMRQRVVQERTVTYLAQLSFDAALTMHELYVTLIPYDAECVLALLAPKEEQAVFTHQLELEKLKQENAILSEHLKQESISLRQEVEENYALNNIITLSENYQHVLKKVTQVAQTNTTTLIFGETGTGKELLARTVHEMSERASRPLIKVNCATFSKELMESELFGHEKGAFTGAHERRIGRFELAHKGTLFLDEVGELPLELQTKLLRVLQEREFERVGGTKTIRVDVRIIAATNRLLPEMVKAGLFREDLYYRLSVFPIQSLPLRERPKDISVLVEFFAEQFAKRQGKTIEKVYVPDLERLEKYHFPGNVRELENIVERSVILAQDKTLRLIFQEGPSHELADEDTFLTLDELSRQHIISALQRTNGVIGGFKGAGRLLGVDDHTLNAKIRKYKIEKREYLV